MKSMTLSCTLLAALAAGCSTSVKVTPVEPGSAASRVGLPHPLMMSRYEGEVRWQIKSCRPALVLTMSAEIKDPVAVPDGENLFVIDPRSLSSPVKTSKLNIEYLPSGAPFKLNAGIEDRSAQTLAAAASLVTGLATFGAVPQVVPAAPSVLMIPGAPAAAAVRPTSVCNADVDKALDGLDSANSKVESLTEALDKATQVFVAAQDRLAVLGANADEASKAAAAAALTARTRAATNLKAALLAQGKVLDTISHSVALEWPTRGSDLRKSIPLTAGVLERWLLPAQLGSFKDDPSAHLALAGRNDAALAPEAKKDIFPDLGIPFRVGAEARLAVCTKAPCGTAGSVVIAERADRLLQFGGVYYLPCISRPFSSVDCSYEMDANGRLKAMGGAYTSASAEGALGALGGVVKEATAARQARRGAATAQLEAQTAYLKAKKASDDAAAALAADPLANDTQATAALKAQAARLDAQRALIESEAALAEAQAKAAVQP